MRHYGIWWSGEEIRSILGDVLVARSAPQWAAGSDDVIFCTTSLGHAVAQLKGFGFGPGVAEVREFGDDGRPTD